MSIAGISLNGPCDLNVIFSFTIYAVLLVKCHSNRDLEMRLTLVPSLPKGRVTIVAGLWPILFAIATTFNDRAQSSYYLAKISSLFS